MKPLFRLVLLFVLLLTCSAGAERLPVASDSDNLWLIVPADDQKQITVYHRKHLDQPFVIQTAIKLKGSVPANNVAAGGGQLWIIYKQLVVQKVSQTAGRERIRNPYTKSGAAAALPDGVEVLGFTVDDAGACALVRVTSQSTLNQLDSVAEATEPNTNSSKPTVSSSEDPSEEDLDAIDASSIDEAEEDEADSQVPAAAADSIVQDRLIREMDGDWQSVAMPKQWVQPQRAWLLSRPNSSQPIIVAAADNSLIRVYEFTDGQWAFDDYQVDLPSLEDIAFAVVDHQIVIAVKRQGTEGQLTAKLSLLRSGKQTPLGELRIDKPSTDRWAFASLGEEAALFNFDAAGKPSMTTMGLAGERSTPSMPMTVESKPLVVFDPDSILMICALSVGMLMMFSVWRREPTWNNLELPEALVLGDMPRRIGAAAIDLFPCIFFASVFTGTPFNEMHMHWPGHSGTWGALVPGAVAIVLFILHTGISETFTGKSLGKMMLGLKVTTLNGESPNMWQFIARNLLKILDLIAWYVLPVLALVGPNRQRLGDLIARTVVVMDRPEDEEEEPTDDGDPYD